MQVCKDVNGPLLEALAKAIDFHDQECVRSLQEGVNLVRRRALVVANLPMRCLSVHKVGAVPISGNGKRVKPDNPSTVDELRKERVETNWALLKRLKPDAHAEALKEACVNDAKLGRMTYPEPLQLDQMEEVHFSPRFGVEQGKERSPEGFCARLIATLQESKATAQPRSVPSTTCLPPVSMTPPKCMRNSLMTRWIHSSSARGDLLRTRRCRATVPAARAPCIVHRCAITSCCRMIWACTKRI